jgi:hypothetical protein
MSEQRTDEVGRPLCRSTTQTGQPCGATARPSGYCTEHDSGPNADLGQRGLSRSELRRVSEAESIKRLIASTTDGMTLAEIRLHLDLDGWSNQAARQDLERDLRQDPDLVESREVRADAKGRNRKQVVFRSGQRR